MKFCLPWMEIGKKAFTRECLQDRNLVTGGLPLLLFCFVYFEILMVHKVGAASNTYLLFWFITKSSLQRAIFERCNVFTVWINFICPFCSFFLPSKASSYNHNVLHKVLFEAKGMVTCKLHEIHAGMKFHTGTKFIFCTLLDITCFSRYQISCRHGNDKFLRVF